MVVGWVEESRYDVSGRTLAVRQAGDPGGRPVVYFHGTPSCRLDAAFADDLCAELGVRMVSFDRPGYGESAAAPFSLSSIARDTASLADTLHVERFATLGHSGGGPFSLACAAVLGDRVIRAGVASGPAPYLEMPGLVDTLDDDDRKALALLPDEAAAAAHFALGFEPFRQLAHASDAEILAGFKRMLSPHDGEVLDRPELGGCARGGDASRDDPRHQRCRLGQRRLGRPVGRRPRCHPTAGPPLVRRCRPADRAR